MYEIKFLPHNCACLTASCNWNEVMAISSLLSFFLLKRLMNLDHPLFI